MKKLLLILFLTLILTACNKLKIDISKDGDTIDYIKTENKKEKITYINNPGSLNEYLKAKKYNKVTQKEEDVYVKVNSIKEADNEDLELYNKTHDKKLVIPTGSKLYKLNYDIKLTNYKTSDDMENGSIDIKVIDKASKILSEIYYLKESEGLKTNDIGNVSILFILNQDQDFIINMGGVYIR